MIALKVGGRYLFEDSYDKCVVEILQKNIAGTTADVKIHFSQNKFYQPTKKSKWWVASPQKWKYLPGQDKLC